MATDTATTQNDTKPAEAPKAATPATPAASTQAKSTSKPRAKTAKKPRAKTAAKSRTRTRSTASSSSRSRTASKSRTRKPAARTSRTETATATTSAPRAETKALNGGQQFVAGVIDAQERTVTALVDYQTRAAEASQIPGATAVASAQAQVLRGVTDAYVSAARALLK
jgi:hypothetical protein